MSRPPFPQYAIEPLRDHERTSFVCGVPELDHYLQHQARQDAKRKVAAPFVMIGTSGEIVGYYTLSAYGIRPAELPAEIAKKLPKYPLLPATLLGRLAISRAHQGQNFGQWLLMDALYRSWKNTAEVASIGVVAEAQDEKARSFYLRYEFMPLADHPNKLFVAMGTIQKAFL